MTFPGGSSGFANPPVGNQGIITRPQFESVNYIPGVSGWAIFRNGNVEFNSGVFRGTVTAGTFQGTDFVINSNGAFFYSGTPALGNLVASIASVAGSDSFGNTYNAGSNSYGPGPAHAIAQLFNGQLTLSFGSVVLPTTLFTTPADKGVTLAAPTTLAGDVQGTLELQSNVGGAVPVVITNAIINEIDPSNSSLPESWHQFSLVGGTSAGNDINATNYPPAYKLLDNGDVALRGVLVTAAGGLAVNTTWATIPNFSQYRPVTNIPVAFISNGTHGQLAHVYVRPNGNMQFNAAISGSISMYLDSILHVAGT